jgi:hypothetical protein
MATVTRMLGVHLHASRCAYAEVQEDSEQFTILDDYTDGCASTAGRYHLSLFGSLACTELRAAELWLSKMLMPNWLPKWGQYV